MKRFVVALAAVFFALTAAAQSPSAAPPTKISDDAKKDVLRHRAIAAAHEAASKCLESGKTEEVCHKELQAACKGLAIGRYCGMRHEH
jgi:hypothetical protein